MDPINKPIEDAIHTDDAPAAPQQVRKDARIASMQAEREQQLNDLSAVLATSAGRAVILRILKHCQPYRTTVISTDIEQYLVAEGRRSVAHWLIDEMGHIAPDVYPNLLIHNAKLAQERSEFAAGVESAGRSKAPR